MNHLAINTVHNDLVLHAIQNKTLNASNLNFQTLRDFAGIDSDKRNGLDRGRLTIHRQDLLNQYLYSYGLMVQRQWDYVVPNIIDMLSDNNDEMIHLYDYGCGQGLATLLLLENTLDFQEQVEKLILIEPSQIALARAEGLMACKLPNISIRSFDKKLDDVKKDDLDIDVEKMNVHIFSNILDIEGFDQFELFNQILEKGGKHYIIAVSNDRNCYGGTARLESLYNALLSIKPQEGENLSITHEQFKQFTDAKNMNHVYFCLKIEIH
ncbi:hypothetical protein [Acinetobacter towneri]|uniref:Methyltransferase domain-containing protein n=1 Tax=Acinetobacter towneri TaxID=202956 RepID=A0A1E8E3J9_9GAMM|nr:hypothetical protein [Acinetobacter towneri]OFE43968.1 hypothetical protein BJN41_04445 [Acinetobacter towneri]